MFKTKLIELLQKLGMIKKFEEKTMSNEEWALVASEFKKAHGIDFLEAVEKAQQFDELKDQHKAAIYELVSTENKGSEGAEPEKDVNLAESIKGLNAELTELKKDKQANQAKIKELEGKIAVLEAEPELDKPIEIVKKSAKVIVMGHRGAAHTAESFMGLPGEFFSRKKWWNEVGATKKEISGIEFTEKQVEDFREAYREYGVALKSRVMYLHEANLLGQENFMASIDYSEFDGSDWGSNEYVVRRQDELISYMRSLPSVSSIFPVQYGVQNKMVMTNAFLGEFSQAYQKGRIFKGGYKFDPEVAKVDKVMFKHEFDELKQLETEYIGYLNREGSDPMKWNFIEWLIARTLEVLHNEKEERRVRGRRIDPTIGEPGPFLFSADGVLERIWSYVDDLKILPFDDIGMYTESTVLDVMKALTEKVNKILSSIGAYKLYMNEKHVPWALDAYREKYGTDMDFRGGLEVKNYNLKGIVPVPNMGNSCMMWITIPKNIELYEDQPGEMEKLYFQRDLESLIATSYWTEGAGSFRAGRQYKTLAELQASKRKYQFIFMNYPVSTILADATTVDATINNRFKTSSNTVATNITDITEPDEGVVYRITCDHTNNATTVNKTGKFDQITANWVPTAVGDYLEVYYKPDADDPADDKFIEVARKVS